MPTPIHSAQTQPTYGGVTWFGGPNAPRRTTLPPPARVTSGPTSSRYSAAGTRAYQLGLQGTGNTGPTGRPAAGTATTDLVRSTLNTSLTRSGTTPQTGGGYQAPTGPGGAGTSVAANPLEDLLRGRIRRIRTLGAGERRDVTDAGLEQGLGRSQGAQLERQRQREMEAVTGAERDFIGGEFENQRALRGQELQAQLERDRLNQQMEIQRQSTALERELSERRFQQEAEQNELERQAALDRAAVSGGGGEGTRIGYGNELQQMT